MNKNIIIALIVTTSISVVFICWSRLFKYSDFAVLALTPFMLVVGQASWKLSMASWRAKVQVVVRPESRLSWFLQGRIQASISSLAIVIFSSVILAWQAVNAGWFELFIFIIAVFITSLGYAAMMSRTRETFYFPFETKIALWIVQAGIGFILMLVLAYYTWAFKQNPDYFLNSSLDEVLEITKKNSSNRDGYVSQIMFVLNGYQDAKLWAVLKLKNYLPVTILYCLDFALIAYLVCRSTILANIYIEDKINY